LGSGSSFCAELLLDGLLEFDEYHRDFFFKILMSTNQAPSEIIFEVGLAVK